MKAAGFWPFVPAAATPELRPIAPPSAGAIAALGACLIALMAIQLLPYGDLSFPGVFMDSYEYLNMAEFFSPWYERQHDRAVDSILYNLFPPFYPLVLALFGGGGERVATSYVIHSVTYCAMFGAIAGWLVSLRISWAWSLTVAMLLCLSTWLHLSSVRISSEPLFIALMLAAFVRMELSNSRRFDLLLVLLVALAVLSRSAGLFLVCALFVACWRQTGSLKLGILHASCAAAPFAAWTLFKSIVADSNYVEIGASRLPDSLAGTLAYVSQQAQATLFALSPWGQESAASAVAAIIILALSLALFLKRLRQAKLDALFAAIYLPVVFVWPYSADTARLATPLLIVFVGYASITVAAMMPSARLGALIARSLLAASLAIPALDTIVRLSVPVDSELAAFKKQDFFFLAVDSQQSKDAVELLYRIVTTLEEIPQHVASTDCIYSAQTRMSGFYADRIFVQSPAAESPAAKQPNCAYVFLSALSYTDRLDTTGKLAEQAVAVMVNEMIYAGKPLKVAVLARVR